MKTRYVAGFLFDRNGEKVALIEKQRPEWQRWKLNGIGGHIDKKTQGHTCYDNGSDQTNFDPCTCPYETPAETMRREFREETGVDLNSWAQFCLLHGPHYEVYFFFAYDDAIYNVATKTDESVAIYEVSRVLDPRITHPLIPNLRWLIPMALSLVYDPVVMYDVQEVLQ
jgi:8-oxo-dGTP diphosphatase